MSKMKIKKKKQPKYYVKNNLKLNKTLKNKIEL